MNKDICHEPLIVTQQFCQEIKLQCNACKTIWKANGIYPVATIKMINQSKHLLSLKISKKHTHVTIYVQPNEALTITVPKIRSIDMCFEEKNNEEYGVANLFMIISMPINYHSEENDDFCIYQRCCEIECSYIWD